MRLITVYVPQLKDYYFDLCAIVLLNLMKQLQLHSYFSVTECYDVDQIVLLLSLCFRINLFAPYGCWGCNLPLGL